MRKHLYLITEHEKQDRVGQIEFSDKRFERANKNEEGPIHKFDKEAQDFITVGKHVGLGYVDFDEEFDDDEALDAMHRKLSEVDSEWLEKAGLDVEEYA